MSQKTIYIVRHGQTDYNKNRIVQGSGVDSSLNATGKKQAAAFFEKYKNIGFEVVLTSRLVRTHQTMAPFINTGLHWEQYPEINEMGWGDHEGKHGTPEMIAEYKAMVEEWKKGNYSASIKNGESALELSQRMSSFVDHLKQRPEEKILVCSHGRAMRCLMTILKQDELFNMEMYSHFNTGLYLTEYIPDRFHFHLENDTTHLEAYPELR